MLIFYYLPYAGRISERRQANYRALLWNWLQMIAILISSGAAENILDRFLHELQDKSLTSLVPLSSVIMSLPGGPAGQNS